MGYTIDSIVKEFIIEGGGSQMNQYARLYQLAVGGLRESNMNESGIIRTIEMPIKVNSTCDLPLDYLQYKRIGILDSDGCLRAMAENNCQSFLQSFDDCGNPEALHPDSVATISTDDGTITDITNTSAESVGWVSGGTPYDGNFRNGEFMGRMFGVNGGNNVLGEFRIDRENQLILVHNLWGNTTSIVMEYLADIESVDGDFEVHPFVIESLKAWIYWKLINRDRNRNSTEKAQAKRDYDIAARWTKKRFTSSTIQDWSSTFRSGNTASVKF